MRALIAISLAFLLLGCHAPAVPTFTDGPITVRLLDSPCSSEVAAAVLEALEAKTEPKRADVMIAGEHVSSCWAEDEDRDILVADRKSGYAAIYRHSFSDLSEVPAVEHAAPSKQI